MNQVENIVIIGGVACGPKAGARIKRLNPNAKVTIIERGDWISYGGCGLPYFVGSTVKDLNDLMTTSWDAVRTPEFMKETKDIDTLLGYKVIKINRNEKELLIKNVLNNKEDIMRYDKLVIATGSYNFLPNIPGIEGEGVFEMKTPRDGIYLQNYLKQGITRAVIIGAGLIGLEVMEACANWGVEVTVIEREDSILPKMLDKDLSVVLQSYLEKEDISFFTSTELEAIIRDEKGKIKAVQTSQGKLDCDLVFFSTGVRSEVKLAKEAGLNCNPGIIVNEYLQTNDPDIYAGGDCVMVKDKITEKLIFAPMGSTANKHGRIIGTNIVQDNTQSFSGVVGTSIIKIFDWSAAKVGLTEQEAHENGFDVVTCIVPGPDITHFMPGKKLIMVKTIADRSSARILGVQIVGPGNVDKRIDSIAAALSINPKLTAYDMGNMDLAYAPPFSSAIDNLITNANVIQNVIEGRAKQVSFFEVLDKLNDDNVIFIDLRCDDEVKQLSGFNVKNRLHIPIEELRKRSGEIPKNKEIILYCILSTRGYEAQLILESIGFRNVKFLQAGIYFWPFDKF